MASRMIGLGALGLACVVAAGGGAYVAVRQAQTGNQQAAITAPPPAATGSQASAQSAPAGLVTTPPAAGEVARAPLPASDETEARKAERAPSPSELPPARHRVPRAETVPDSRRNAAASPEDNLPRSAGSQGIEPPNVSSLPPVPIAGQPPVSSPEPQREFVEVTVPAESVLGLQVQTAVSSETARVEDRVDARVTRDVRVNDRIAIPAGSQVIGSIMQVDRGGKVKDRAHFAIRFHTLVLPDGSRTPMTAEALHREGPSPANKSAAKIGGAAVGGAILGAILGGGKGAAIGGSIGAAGGTAATMAGDREPAKLEAGSVVNVRLMSPLTVTLER